MQYIVTILANLLLLAIAVRTFGMWARRERAGIVPLLFACVLLAGLALFPQLITNAPGAYIDAITGDHSTPATPGSHRPQPDDDASAAGIDVPWRTLAMCAAGALILASVIAIALALRQASHRRATDRKRRAETEARHDRVLDAYAAFTTDVLAVLDRPALGDVTVPETERLIRALEAAREARADSRSDYRTALWELEIAWTSADRHARKQGTTLLPRHERRAVEQARLLLATALDEDGNSHERQLAYHRAMRLIGHIIDVPKEAVAVLSERACLSLPTGPSTQ
ncbi:hypothetical protein ABR737_01005 [Streptomyces sp. Edi2]|uniref:hypothetical protein n=1 Tax=Streptomyces sp. Edi2 TaxID=3162528 RepID=UPI0033067933